MATIESDIELDAEPNEQPAPPSPDQRLIDHLVGNGRVRETDVRKAERLAEESGHQTVAMLVSLGLISERDLAESMASLLELPLIGVKDYPEVPPGGVELPLRFMREQHAVPVSETDDAVTVVMADPRDRFLIEAIELATGRQVATQVGVRSEIDDVVERFYGGGRSAMGQIVENLSDDDAGGEEDIEQLKDLASEAPVIRLVNLIMQRAVEARASDIHIEPFENRLKVRYRVDGVLQEVEAPPSSSTAAVISRIKIMAKLNIAERRLPQDGRIPLRVQGKELDLRVSTVPTQYGESVVMRILDREGVVLDFEKLGFQDPHLGRFKRVLAEPHGIILVTGPTGSGKTTTLYTALSSINTPERKIITVEDPVEYELEGVNQIHVKPSIGLTFASALRAIVRQDPDVIMIGEMRDLETAKIAIQSALTGHLVLSTIHTNDAAGGVTRLLDMGVDDYLLVSTVNGILAQRLVRRLDQTTCEAFDALPEMVTELGLERFADPGAPLRLFRPVPSEDVPTGYLGRTTIMEFLELSDPIRRLVMRHADATEIHELARTEGMRTMYEDGLKKCLDGVTTIEEVLRVTQEG
ncbi:MAG: type II secretion system ATPase GspE [Pseudomonadota bacterium]